MPITFLASTSARVGAAASTWSIAITFALTGGETIIVGVGPASSVVSVSTMTDNTTNVYRLAVRAPRTIGTSAGAELWYATGISSASTRISITNSATSSGSLAVGHWTNVSTANAVLQTGSSETSVASTVHAVGQLTPSENNALVVMFSQVAPSTTIAPVAFDGGMSVWATTNAARAAVGSYIIQVGASTVTGQWRTNAGVSTGAVQSAQVLAAFSDTGTAPAGGGVAVPCCSFLLQGVG